MTSHSESKLLNAEEKEFVQRLAAHYTPTPMTLAQQAAFDRALEERITRRARPSFFRPVALVATACAALLIWFAVPRQGTDVSHRQQPGTVAVATENPTQPESEDELLTYAYYDPDFYGDESDEAEEEGFLPDDYEALVSAFALPDV